MTALTRDVPWARLAAAGAALSTVVLAGCSGTSADAGAGRQPSTTASDTSAAGSEGAAIGHQSQWVVQTKERPSDALLRRIKHLPGVFFAQYEPMDTQVRVYFGKTITRPERHDAKQQIKRLLG